MLRSLLSCSMTNYPKSFPEKQNNQKTRKTTTKTTKTDAEPICHGRFGQKGIVFRLRLRLLLRFHAFIFRTVLLTENLVVFNEVLLQYSPSFSRQLPMCGEHVRLYKHRVGYVGQPRSMVYLTIVVCHTVYIYVCVCVRCYKFFWSCLSL